jgi:hypothetical protein
MSQTPLMLFWKQAFVVGGVPGIRTLGWPKGGSTTQYGKVNVKLCRDVALTFL